MRRQVKGKRIKRPFGCSWVEVDGAVHRFVIEDTTHMKSMRSSSMRQQWCVYCLPIQLSIIMELEGSFWFLSMLIRSL